MRLTRLYPNNTPVDNLTPLAGIAFYIKDNKLCFVHNYRENYRLQRTFTLETNPNEMRVFWQREAGTQGYGGISVLRLSGAGESKTLCVWPQSAVPQYPRYPTKPRFQTFARGAI